MKHKLIILSAMHGRHETVKRCIELNSALPIHMVYSTIDDGIFLDQFDLTKIQFNNVPLTHKWNAGVKSLRDVDFDAVIILGSDDYLCQEFIDFVDLKIKGLDLVGFNDMYFESEDGIFYWGGYGEARKTEPIGAGRTYSKSFLERIDYNLFPETKNKGLDGVSWRKCKASDVNMELYSMRENGIYIVDIKDGEGMTPINTITGLIKIPNPEPLKKLI